MVDSILLTDCYKIIKIKYPDEEFSIIDYKIENYSKDGRPIGYSGDHLRLSCTISKNNTNSIEQFFIKVKPDDTRNQPFDAMNRQNNIFQRESTFYRRITRLTTWSAQFYGFYNKQCLVFEDLSLRGYKNCSNVTNLDLEHCTIVMRTLAAFHATTLGYSGNDFSEILHHDNTELNRQYRCTDRAAIECLINAFAGDLKRDLLNEAFFDFYKSRSPSQTYPNAINHGDLWGNNILFTYEGEKPNHCRLVDFQTMVTAPPALDVMFFLHGSTTVTFLKAHKMELLKTYYTHLEKDYGNLDGYYSESDFLRSCEEYSLPSKLLSTRYKSVLFLQNNECVNNLDFFYGGKAVEKYLNQALKCDLYRSNLSPVINDLIESIQNFK